VFQNLTEIKRLEQEVRVKEKLAAVGEMAARLAHEIRNPLGSISGSAQVLMGEPNISVEQGRLLAIITRESKRLSDTLNQFLYQARSSPAARGPVDVGRLVSEAVTLLRNGPEVGPTHTVEFEMDTGSHVCLADPDQITQVFWNLTRNALEAMPRGGTLKVRVFMEGDTLVLSCRDQGRGIGREEQRRVFEPFQSGTPMGTGLGLAIVYQIVRDHGGDIAVRSTPGQGTDVQVRIPLLVHTPVPA
jgi:two-component system, NtrC family, sensor histidine kinase PilS